MTYSNESIAEIAKILKARAKELDQPRDILKADELKQLFAALKDLPEDQRGDYGKALNTLKSELEAIVGQLETNQKAERQQPIDVTAPFDVNVAENNRPKLFGPEVGSIHPLTKELWRVIDIFTRMGFEAIESRQIDNDFNMFSALNFPEDHPARDGYDTFRTEEGLIPPAHTSTMQNRILRLGKTKLEKGEAIATISYGRCFRNEDVDNTHDHTFYQVEGVYVSKTATLGDMLGVLRSLFEVYYGQSLKIKTQPGYFPFVEPGLEFLIEKPASIGGRPGEWLEMLGCGMIHPNVLSAAGIDSGVYQGFAWGGMGDRLVMLKYGIEDIRYFQSAKLDFLRKLA